MIYQRFSVEVVTSVFPQRPAYSAGSARYITLSRKPMSPALGYFSERHGKEFADAARRCTSLHGRWVSPPTQAKAAEELASRRQGPNDFGFLIHDLESSRIAGYIEATNIVRGPFMATLATTCSKATKARAT